MLLSPIFTSNVMIISASSENVSYDRQAAYDYAKKYWDKVTSDGYFWDSSSWPTKYTPGQSLTESQKEGGWDCSHYVSCCIGNEPNEKGGGLNVPPGGEGSPAYGKARVKELGDWLLSSGLAESKSSVNDLCKGDVIQYDFTGDGTWDHSALHLGSGKISTHSNSRFDIPWDLGAKKHRFIHIKDACVGGVWVPVDKFGLLAPYVGLASTIVVATAATAIYLKRVKREKQM